MNLVPDIKKLSGLNGLTNNKLEQDIKRYFLLFNVNRYKGVIALNNTLIDVVVDDKYLIMDIGGQEVKTKLELISNNLLIAIYESLRDKINLDLGFIGVKMICKGIG